MCSTPRPQQLNTTHKLAGNYSPTFSNGSGSVYTAIDACQANRQARKKPRPATKIPVEQPDLSIWQKCKQIWADNINH
jgi:hypothetical protein